MFTQANNQPRITSTWLAAISVATLLVMSPAVEAKRQGSFTGTASITQGSVLRIQNRRGNIVIRSDAIDFVQVHADIVDNTDRGDQAGRYTPAEVIAYLERKPPIAQEENEVRVGYMMDEEMHLGVAIHYDIWVPPWVSLEIEAQHGELEVYGVSGPIEIEKRSGLVRVNEPGDRLEASIDNASLQVLGTPLAEWSLESSLGDIGVVLPHGLAFELNAETQGQMESEFPLGEHKAGRFDGAINGGGVSVRIRSERGALTIFQR